MNRLFKKKVDSERPHFIPLIVVWVNRKAKQFALYLSYKTEHVQPKRMATAIILSCLFFSVCLCLVVYRMTFQGSPLHVTSIRAPTVKFYQQPKKVDMVLNRIRLFHHKLDSLQISDSATYNSFLKSRPHLLDSIRIVEQFSNE